MTQTTVKPKTKKKLVSIIKKNDRKRRCELQP